MTVWHRNVILNFPDRVGFVIPPDKPKQQDSQSAARQIAQMNRFTIREQGYAHFPIGWDS